MPIIHENQSRLLLRILLLYRQSQYFYIQPLPLLVWIQPSFAHKLFQKIKQALKKQSKISHKRIFFPKIKLLSFLFYLLMNKNSLRIFYEGSFLTLYYHLNRHSHGSSHLFPFSFLKNPPSFYGFYNSFNLFIKRTIFSFC